jgi:hypothetical protein
MGGFFGGGDSPSAPPTPPPAPTLDGTRGEGDIAARELALRLQRGRSATMLTGGAGLTDTGSTSKVLLGS